MAAPTHALFPAALCSTLAGGRESKGRNALRPDGSCRPRRAGPVKGGAAWRRDRSRAQPRAAEGEHGEHGEDLPLDRAEHCGISS